MVKSALLIVKLCSKCLRRCRVASLLGLEASALSALEVWGLPGRWEPSHTAHTFPGQTMHLLCHLQEPLMEPGLFVSFSGSFHKRSLLVLAMLLQGQKWRRMSWGPLCFRDPST